MKPADIVRCRIFSDIDGTGCDDEDSESAVHVFSGNHRGGVENGASEVSEIHRGKIV